jgi:hypothetical protein
VRSLVEVHLPSGVSAGLVVPWMDLGLMDWTEYLQPLARLLADQSEAVWTAEPIPDDTDDKGALLGH